jgi:hypothetical protein
LDTDYLRPGEEDCIMTDRELQLQAQLDTALERVAKLEQRLRDCGCESYADPLPVQFTGAGVSDLLACKDRRITELEAALSTLVYWHNHDNGHIDESWWDEAARVLGGGK